MQGYVALHRKVMDSWVAEDPMALALWVRMLLEATHTPRRKGHKGAFYNLNKGEFLFGLQRWSEKTGISREVIRKRIELFESSGMITYSKHPQISIISIVNWNNYQTGNTVKTPSDQTETTLGTPSDHKYNNGDNGKNVKNELKDSPAKRKRFTPPTIEEVSAYMVERCGNSNLAQKFIDHYESNGWMVGRTKMKDWKAAVRKWLGNNFGNQPAKQSRTVDPCAGQKFESRINPELLKPQEQHNEQGN